MRIPVLNETLVLLVNGKSQPAICTDVFDGGWCWYFDATFPKTIRHQFSAGEQCAVTGFGDKCRADFVNYPTGQKWKVRFLMSK